MNKEENLIQRANKKFKGYSINSGVYQVFNKRKKSMMEFINVTVNDNQTEVTPDVDEDHYLTG